MIPRLLLRFVLLGILGLPIVGLAQGIPRNTGQLVVVFAKGWDEHRGSMQCFERDQQTGAWRPMFASEKPVLLGRSGLAWGRGVLPQALPRGQRSKVEGDGRSPAGVFAIGRVFGYAPGPPVGTRLRYRQVTQWDCWIDDVKNPLYNQHVVIDPQRGIPPWHKEEKMKMGDHAHSLKLEIRHNTNPAEPGFGSAIFFHIRRGPDRATAGCTTMKEADLVQMIQWLDPKLAPHMVLLPRDEYVRLRGEWKLP